MSAEVHEQGGLWIAPAAPGFDARLIGGTTVVERVMATRSAVSWTRRLALRPTRSGSSAGTSSARTRTSSRARCMGRRRWTSSRMWPGVKCRPCPMIRIRPSPIPLPIRDHRRTRARHRPRPRGRCGPPRLVRHRPTSARWLRVAMTPPPIARKLSTDQQEREGSWTTPLAPAGQEYYAGGRQARSANHALQGMYVVPQHPAAEGVSGGPLDPADDTSGEPSSHGPLTDRQLEILVQVARGRTNRGVGQALGISERTVRNHLRTISHKLSTSDRTRAVVLSIERGWIAIPLEPESTRGRREAVEGRAQSTSTQRARVDVQHRRRDRGAHNAYSEAMRSGPWVRHGEGGHLMSLRRGWRRRVAAVVAASVVVAVQLPTTPPVSAAVATQLRRYPYLTDVVAQYATINWATDRSLTTGRATYGIAGSESCTANTVTASRTAITVNGVGLYQWEANLALAPNTRYCYRVFGGTPSTCSARTHRPSSSRRSPPATPSPIRSPSSAIGARSMRPAPTRGRPT